jgi:L-amino acid N-acyltransferase YncA
LQKWATSEEVLTLVARAYEDDIVSRKLLQAEGFEECGIEHVLEHGRTRHVIRAVWEDGDAG